MTLLPRGNDHRCGQPRAFDAAQSLAARNVVLTANKVSKELCTRTSTFLAAILKETMADPSAVHFLCKAHITAKLECLSANKCPIDTAIGSYRPSFSDRDTHSIYCIISIHQIRLTTFSSCLCPFPGKRPSPYASLWTDLSHPCPAPCHDPA